MAHEPHPSLPSIPPPGSYRIDTGRSGVVAVVKAMLGVLNVHGHFKVSSGTVTVGADPRTTTVEVAVDTASYDSGNATRDRDVLSPTLLDAARYPTMTFASRSAQRDGEGWALQGVVGAHGAEVPTTLRVDELTIDGDVVKGRISGELDRTDFGVTNKKGMVGRRVRLSIDVTLHRS
ncbi:MAG: YceI family protein [Acidimicrobiales bacterium]